MKKQVNIVVSSTQIVDGEDEERKFKISNMGTMSYDDGKYVLEYDETELTGMEGTVTQLTFSESTPNEVYLSRHGTVSSSLYFKKGERYMTTYNTGIMPIQLSVNTKRIKNNVNYAEGGEIHIEYNIEMFGMCAEQTDLKVIVKC